MKRLLTFFPMLLPILLWAQNYAPFHAPYMGSVTHSINQTLTSSDTIALTNYSTIYSLSINATILQPSEGSFVRIVLEDIDGHDYLVAESDWMRNDSNVVFLTDYCEETSMLNGVIPVLLKCYLSDATLTIRSVNIVPCQTNNRNEFSISSVREIRLAQARSVIDRINSYNEQKRKLWRADITDLSLQPYSIRKRILSLPDECSSQGIEYYVGGIFDMGSSEITSSSKRNTSLYIESFDWRNRHGKNWMTPIRHQGNSGYCWAFSSVAATEALTNLYYNQKLDIDLSDQDVAYYSYPEYHNDSIYYPYKRGYFVRALSYIRNNGVIDESSLPFIDDSIPRLPHVRTGQYNELVKIKGSGSVFLSNPDSAKLDKIKKSIIERGPLVSGFRWMPNDSTNTKAHAMALVGYGVIQAGDTLMCYNHYWAGSGMLVVPDNSPYLGQTYWIFKNSYGENDGNGHSGYVYILFKDLWSFYTTYYIKTPITSINYSNSDIAIEDCDGDGYYNWGIGPRPAHCPAWAPDEPDGDDSDATLGPMNEYGYCASIIPTDTIYINSNEHFSNGYQYITKNICVRNNSTLTVSCDLLMNHLAEIHIKPGSTLIIDGCIRNAQIKAEVGSTIILNDGGKIITYQDDSFELPVGATLQINNGTIE